MNAHIFDKNKLLVIAGPCSLENETVTRKTAETLAELNSNLQDICQIVFKGSFDKANRTSINNSRGPGIDSGLDLLLMVKNEYKLPVLTDVHTADQVQVVAKICDAIQIPAFLCRQTDLLIAAAKSGKTVNVKKGQFLSPHDMKFIVEKLEVCDAAEIWQTERGTTFGYGNLVVDMRSFKIMNDNKYPTIFDVTHSLQMPGTGIGITSGDRQFAEPLAKAAIAAGANGLFIETHPDPQNAISDSMTQIPLNLFQPLIERCIDVWDAVCDH